MPDLQASRDAFVQTGAMTSVTSQRRVRPLARVAAPLLHASPWRRFMSGLQQVQGR